ncbi:LysM peptidoglycan-binding domain-containing protein [Weissella muntiaci]|uniref:LysM peptidoglycan-binding domain-containing protein n=1 Tax=Weissella muntiaci TaxID=2508881 RepID=A0A6C2C8K2_9LACO|nr:LysM peptidoglycan-binding domain-containing protein [Weissella muntiaci]TYC49906.1 LysM peptidoglycan-binding domain-containing protein [Weissella muntiaci]
MATYADVLVTKDNTVSEIKDWLVKHNQEAPSNATKAELLELVNATVAAESGTSESESTTTDTSASESTSESDVLGSESETIVEPDEPAVDDPRYTVKDGDTIASVATSFHLSVAKLRQFNLPLKYTLTVGQQLNVTQ